MDIIECTKHYIETLRRTVFEQHQCLQQRHISCPVTSMLEIDVLVGRKKNSLLQMESSSGDRPMSCDVPPMVSVTAPSQEGLQVQMPMHQEVDGSIQIHDQHLLGSLMAKLNLNLKALYRMMVESPQMGYWILKAVERCRDITSDVINFQHVLSDKAFDIVCRHYCVESEATLGHD